MSLVLTRSLFVELGFSHCTLFVSNLHLFCLSADGEGNFRFCVSANCLPGIPYFPAGYAEQDGVPGFAIGTENDAVLHSAFQVGCLCHAEVLDNQHHTLSNLMCI